MQDKDEIISAAHKFISKGQIDNAISEYFKLLSSCMDGNIHNIIGDLYLKKESSEDAVKHFRKAARMFRKEGSLPKAIAMYHRVLSINPDQYDVVIELAELNAEKGFIKQAVVDLIRAAEAYRARELPMKAIRIYKKALNVNPSNTNLKIRMAELRHESGHIDSALKMYLAIASEYEINAESVKAEKMYQKVLTIDPDNVESLKHLSRLAEDDQDPELAFEYISRAASLAPDNNEIMFDYKNMADKINKDMSESPQKSLDGHGETPHNMELPETDDNYYRADTQENTVWTDVKKNMTHSPESAASTPLPASAGVSSYEESCDSYQVRHETVDGNRHEEKERTTIYEDIWKAGASDAENTNAFKETAHAKSIKDSRRLKRRVKNRGLQIFIVLFFMSVAAISFFATYRYIKSSQTVDVEAPKHVMSVGPSEDIEVDESENSNAADPSVSIEDNAYAPQDQDMVIEEQAAEGREKTEEKTNAEGALTLPAMETIPSEDEEENSAVHNDAQPADSDEGTGLSVVPDTQEVPVEENRTDENTESNIKEIEIEPQPAETDDENLSGTMFEESFDNNSNNWDIVDTPAAHVQMKDGKYYIKNRRETGAYITFNGPGLSSDHSFEIESDIISSGSSANGSFGVVFGVKNSKDFFVFQLLPEGNYSIRKYYTGVPLEMAGGPVSEKVYFPDRFNSFKIKNEANKLSFYINDHFINQISGIFFSYGKTGFFADEQTEIAVDKLHLHQEI